MLKTLEDAYKVSSLLKNPLSALEGFYWLTLGGAKALKLNQFIGNFDSGNEADFIVIDVAASNVIRHRVEHVNSIEELLFCLMILGDDRLIEKTYIQGQLAYSKDLY